MTHLVVSALLMIAWLSPSVALADPARHDDKVFQAKLSVVTDGEGHYIAFTPGDSHRDDRIFYGDAKTLHRVPYYSWSSVQDQSFSFTFSDPRFNLAGLEMREGRFWVKCNDTERDFTPLNPEDTQKFLASVSFLEAHERRKAHFLGRDDFGRYFYVDRGLAWKKIPVKEGGYDYRPQYLNDFRLYSGERGDMKKMKMRNVVSDTAGEIFSSRGGTLRLILDTAGNRDSKNATWITGERRTTLTEVPIRSNRKLVYIEMGVYSGEPFGTPCDDR